MIIVCQFCGGNKKWRFTEKGSQVTVGPRTSDKLNLIMFVCTYIFVESRGEC